MKRIRSLTLAPWLLLAVPAAAADLFVGPGQPYAETHEAIAAAAPGDRIFVAPGIYAAFELDKPVEIRGAGPTVTRVSDFLTLQGATVAGIPAGAVATLASLGLEHADPTGTTDQPLLEISGNPGTVVLQDVHVNVISFAQPLSARGSPRPTPAGSCCRAATSSASTDRRSAASGIPRSTR
jgi:hypothetical protein